jgi:hypothetical protein
MYLVTDAWILRLLCGLMRWCLVTDGASAKGFLEVRRVAAAAIDMWQQQQQLLCCRLS